MNTDTELRRQIDALTALLSSCKSGYKQCRDAVLAFAAERESAGAEAMREACAKVCRDTDISTTSYVVHAILQQCAEAIEKLNIK